MRTVTYVIRTGTPLQKKEKDGEKEDKLLCTASLPIFIPLAFLFLIADIRTIRRIELKGPREFSARAPTERNPRCN